MAIFQKTFILLFSFLFSQLLFADNFIVEHYTVDNGLIHENVNCVIKSSDGLIWLGTWHGLCSFDGEKIKSYNLSNKFQQDVPPRKIQDILEDKYGNLWLKTIDHKVYVFDRKHEQFYSIFQYLNKNISVNSQIIKLTKTLEGDFLLLTKDKDLLLAKPNLNVIPEIELLYESDNRRIDSKLKENILIEYKNALCWIGMDFSIFYFNKEYIKKDGVPQKITEGLSNSSYTSIFDSAESIWVGNQNGSVYMISKNTGSITEYTNLNGQGGVQHISYGNDLYAYINIENKGLYSLNTQTNETTLIYRKKTKIIQTEYDYYGLVWFVTDSNEVLVYDTKLGFMNELKLPVSQILNNNTLVHNAGALGVFVLSVSGNVYQYDRALDKLISLTLNDNQKDDDKISNILLDKDNVLWLTSYDNGFYQINFPKRNFNIINHTLDLNYVINGADNGVAVKTLFQDTNGDIWIGSKNSKVFRFDEKGRLKNKYSSNNFNIGNVYHIMQDNEGVIWFSTKGQGLVSATYDNNSDLGFKFKRYLHDPEQINSISSNDVYFSYQDSKGRVWVATFGGGLNLIQMDNSYTIFKNKINSFANYPDFGQYMEIRSIVEDDSGRIWVGTTNGLMSLDGGFHFSRDIEFETYKNNSEIFNNDVYYLFKDREGSIWISIFGVGLSRLRVDDQCKHQTILDTYGIRDGLNSDVVLAIKEDDSGNLWFSTERGISRLNKSDFSIRNFDKYDGLPEVSFVESSSMCLSDGNLWFGSLGGILSFSPDAIRNNDNNYPLYIIDIRVSNKDYDIWSTDSVSVEYLDKITLKHNQSMFSIEYAALNYSTQNHISYKYILEGYEKEWHEVDKNRVASFSNIPHGKYVFRVKAEDVTNPSLNSERTLQITILPPWWKSTWAYIVYIALFSILLYVILRITMLFIKMRNDVYIEHTISDLKLKFFTNVSHELRTPLTLIQVPIEELKEENLSEKGRRYINMVEKNAIHMVDLVNQILDFRKIENNKMRLRVSLIDLNQVAESLYNEFIILSEENEISFDFNLESENIILWADKDKLEIVIRNIISNAFKFTPSGGSILITTGVNYKSNTCYIRVDDTGVGISESKIDEIFERYSQSNTLFKGTGIGLALSKELVALHHGEIKVESIEHEGSSFVVELYLGKEHFKESDVDFYLSDIVDESYEDRDVVNKTLETSEDTVSDSDKPTLMIVEDNKSLCNLLKLQLEDKYNIHIAHDGEEGLQKVHLYHPDIVITDQMMPKMGGLELLEQIRDDFQVSHIPVIVLTAKNSDNARLKAFQLGANAYIIKPFSKKHLIARIEQLLIERKNFRERLLSNDIEMPQTSNYSEYLVKKDVEFLEEVHRIIEKNMNNSSFNIDVIAVSLNLSRSSFFKKLKSITGLSPIDLVREIRLGKAVELIKSTDMTVTEIAFAVGFKDPGYFGKCFRRKYNLTPREYANTYRAKDN